MVGKTKNTMIYKASADPITGKKEKKGLPREKRRKTINKPGMKNAITFRMMLYTIVSPVIVFNQFVVLLLSIVIPANAKYSPCKGEDAELDTFRSKMLHFFFGIAYSHR